MKGWHLLVVPTLLLLLACTTGRRQHSVVTGQEGSLEGLAFVPPDHSLEVETDTDPEIFWVRGSPPSQFTVTLKRIDQFSESHSVPTELVRLGPEGTHHWKLKVPGSLAQGSLHSIIVTSATERKEAWFLTEMSFPLRSLSGRSATEGPSPTAKEEHLIRIGDRLVNNVRSTQDARDQCPR